MLVILEDPQSDTEESEIHNEKFNKFTEVNESNNIRNHDNDAKNIYTIKSDTNEQNRENVENRENRENHENMSNMSNLSLEKQNDELNEFGLNEVTIPTDNLEEMSMDIESNGFYKIYELLDEKIKDNIIENLQKIFNKKKIKLNVDLTDIFDEED